MILEGCCKDFGRIWGGILEGFRTDFGRSLEGFLKDFIRIPGRSLKGFGRILEGILERCLGGVCKDLGRIFVGLCPSPVGMPWAWSCLKFHIDLN